MIIRTLPKIAALKLIKLYQATLSPDHGPLKGLHPYGFCRHEPTCSEYGKQMIGERGVIVGGLLTIRRVCSCNPFHPPSEQKTLSIIRRNYLSSDETGS